MSSQGCNEGDARRVMEWKKATMKHFKVFGCPTYAFKSESTRISKLEPKRPNVFLWVIVQIPRFIN
jgi:hypothetical protein